MEGGLLNVTLALQSADNSSGGIVFDRYPDKLKFLDAFHPTYLIIDRFITPLWLILGYITNPLSALVWLDRRLRRNNSSAIYLAALSICDFAFLLVYLMFEFTEAWGFSVYTDYGLCESFYFFYYWPQYLSPLLVLGFTVERYIAVCFPFHKEKFCTVRRAVYVISALVLFSLLLSVMQPVSYGYNPHMHTCLNREALRDIFYVWNWVTEMMVFGVVPIAVLVFNTKVLLVIKRLSRQMPQQGTGSSTTASTVTLLCVSFYLILTTLPVTIVYILGFIVPMGNVAMLDAEIRVDPTWNRWFTFMTVRKLVEEICLSRYCLYFFIYFGTGPQFRRTLKKKLHLTNICRGKHNQNGQYKSVATNGQSLTTTIM